MNRRGVEMSLNLIIYVVIGLVVLALILYLLVKYNRGGDRDFSDCDNKGGRCDSECREGETSVGLFGGGCPDGQKCCMQAGFSGDG